MSTILIVERNGKNMKPARDLMDSWLRKLCVSPAEHLDLPFGAADSLIQW